MTSAQIKKGITSMIVVAVFSAILIGSVGTAEAAVSRPSSPSSAFSAFFGIFGWGGSSSSVTTGGSNTNSVVVRIGK